LTRPFDHGAAIVVYSSTKYLGGHGTSIGGLIVDGGNFPWGDFAERQPALNTPDPSYHGAVWSEAVKPIGPVAYIIKARVTLLRDLGSAISPFNAFLTLQGIETLALRMERHCANALRIAQWLEARPDVEKVIYPGLASHPQHALAVRQMTGGFGGIISVVLKTDLEGSRRVLERTQLFTLAESLGGVESLIEHPAIMTHASIPPAQRHAMGILDSFLRLSVGIEDAGDLIADLDQAMRGQGAKNAPPSPPPAAPQPRRRG